MTNNKMSKSIVNVGVDVGKASLDIYIYEKAIHWQEYSTPEGIKRILKRLLIIELNDSSWRPQGVTSFY